MSNLADKRWTMVRWIHSRGLTVEDAIQLVNSVEGRAEAILYAESKEEKIDAEHDYADMIETIHHIWGQLVESKNG